MLQNLYMNVFAGRFKERGWQTPSGVLVLGLYRLLGWKTRLCYMARRNGIVEVLMFTSRSQ